MARHRLFFALSPPPAVRERLEQVAGELTAAEHTGGRPTLAERMHVTLAFLGEFDDEDAVTRALDVGERVRGAAFVLDLDQAASFGPTWFFGSSAPPAAVAGLHKSLNAELVREGFALERRSFHPHVTFLRDAGHALPSTRIAPILWPVENFLLFDSHPAERRYEQLATWPLVR